MAPVSVIAQTIAQTEAKAAKAKIVRCVRQRAQLLTTERSFSTVQLLSLASHLTDHVFPRLPVRQWVLSVPKRLRYFLQRDTALQGAVLRILLRGVERCLRERSPGCDPTARIGAIAFIHRFGSSLNEHTHFSYGRFA